MDPLHGSCGSLRLHMPHGVTTAPRHDAHTHTHTQPRTLGLPPSTQSENSNNGCRTGFENETRPLSTNVMCSTPHPSRHLAMLQPRVPAPRQELWGQLLHTHTHTHTHTRTHTRTSAKQQTLHGMQCLCVKRRNRSPFHEVQVQVDRTLGDSLQRMPSLAGARACV